MELYEKNEFITRLKDKWYKNGNTNKTKFLYYLIQVLYNTYSTLRMTQSINDKLIENMTEIHILSKVLNRYYKNNWSFEVRNYSNLNLLIYFPKINLKNDFDESYTLRDSVVSIPIVLSYVENLPNIVLNRIRFMRTSFTKREIENNFFHSHVNNGSIFSNSAMYFNNFCEGKSNFKSLRTNAIKIPDRKDYYESLFQFLEDMLGYESTAGVYYKSFTALKERKSIDHSIFGNNVYKYLEKFIKEIFRRNIKLKFILMHENNDKIVYKVNFTQNLIESINEIAKENPVLHRTLIKKIGNIEYEPLIELDDPIGEYKNILKSCVSNKDILSQEIQVGNNILKLKFIKENNNVENDLFESLQVSEKVLKNIEAFINIIINKTNERGRYFRD